jgi:predicted metal-dependent phosphotriesterase family hydrolase
MIKLKNLLTEKQLKGLEGIPDNKKLAQISDAEKLKIVQAAGNIIDFIVPDWAKGTRNFWQVISQGSIKKKKNLGGDIIYFLPGRGIQSPAYSSIKELLNGIDWKSMEETRRFNK